MAEQQSKSVLRRPFSRRQFMALAGSVTGGAFLAACAAPAPAAQPEASEGGSAAAAPATVSHWVYSTLPLDRDTLESVPADQTENVINYFDWSLEKFNEIERDTTVNLEYLPHNRSWFYKIDY